MATSSHLVPQALHIIPRNATQSLKNLGFSSFLVRGPTTNARISVSRVSLNHSCLNFGSSDLIRAKREVIVRAEANPEGDGEVVGEGEGEGKGKAEAALDIVGETEGEVDGDVEAEGEVTEAVESQAEGTKAPRKSRIKLGDIMGILNQRAIEAAEKERPVPDIRAGDIVEVKLEVPENRKRLSVYKGIVMSKQNAGIHSTIRIRRIIAGIGVEIVFPLYSPNIKEIKVASHRKVRRAKLYYLRDKLPRLSTFR